MTHTKGKWIEHFMKSVKRYPDKIREHILFSFGQSLAILEDASFGKATQYKYIAPNGLPCYAMGEEEISILYKLRVQNETLESQNAELLESLKDVYEIFKYDLRNNGQGIPELLKAQELINKAEGK